MSSKFNTPVTLPNLSSAPSPAENGYIYYDTTLKLTRVYQNGSWINVSSGEVRYEEDIVNNSSGTTVFYVDRTKLGAFRLDYSIERKSFNSIGYDSTFMDNGVVTYYGTSGQYFISGAFTSTGLFLAGGSFSTILGTSGRDKLAVYNLDGTINTAFSANAVDGSKFNSNIATVLEQEDGKILISGGFTSYGSSGAGRLIRLNSDGTEDSTFNTNIGTNFNGSVLSGSVDFDKSGNIYAGGIFTNYGGTTGRNRFVKLNPDGSIDATFTAATSDGTKFNSNVMAVKVGKDGVFAVGDFTNYGGLGYNRLVKFNFDGSVDTSFCDNASTFNNIVWFIDVQVDGKVLLVGDFTNYGGTTGRNKVVRLNADGTADVEFCQNASDGAKIFGSTGNMRYVKYDKYRDLIYFCGVEQDSYQGVGGYWRAWVVNSDGTINTDFGNPTFQNTYNAGWFVYGMAFDDTRLATMGNYPGTDYSGSADGNLTMFSVPTAHEIEKGSISFYYDTTDAEFKIGDHEYIGDDSSVDFSISQVSGDIYKIEYTSGNITDTIIKDKITCKLRKY